MSSTSFQYTNQYPNSKEVGQVVFAPVQDSTTGDENLEPPFVRVRSGNTAYLHLDADTDTQVIKSTNTQSWIVGSSGNQNSKSNLYARKIKRMSVSFIQYLFSTPCINEQNQTIKFHVSDNPLIELTATIPAYNYTILSVGDTPVAPANLPIHWNPLIPNLANIPVNLDPNDGILDKFVKALNYSLLSTFPLALPFTLTINSGVEDALGFPLGSLRGVPYSTAVTPYLPGPASNPQQISKYIFFTLVRGGATFIFSGGNLFERGLHAMGVKNIVPVDFNNPANYYIKFNGGPCTFLYSRWLDFTSNTLLKHAKIPPAGTSVPTGLIERIYLGSGSQELGIVSYSPAVPNMQVINWRKDEAIIIVDLQIRDEYGDLLNVPSKATNTSWLSMEFSMEL